MTIENLSLDNILTSAPVVAGVITAILAAFKLFSDKAAKTTEFRRAWVESFRTAVATFVGNVHTIFGRIAIRHKHAGQGGIDSGKEKSNSRLFDWYWKPVKKGVTEPLFDKEMESELTVHWLALRKSYNEIILHVNAKDHGAYLIAESYISKKKDAQDLPFTEISNFLEICIEVATIQLSNYTKEFPSFNRSWHAKLWRFLRSLVFSSGEIFVRTTPYSKLNKELQEVNDGKMEQGTSCELANDSNNDLKKSLINACSSPDSAVLLASFAMREYLHDEYHAIPQHRAHIERCIRVVDTATALMLKETWEKIKEGESTYGAIVPFFLIVIMASIVLALFYAGGHLAEKKESPKSGVKVPATANISKPLMQSKNLLLTTGGLPSIDRVRK